MGTQLHDDGYFDEGGFRPTRRWLGGALVATAAVGGAQVPMSLTAAAAAPTRTPTTAFAIDAAPGVKVLVGRGRHFRVIAVDGDDVVLERFDDVTSASIHRLHSEHFSVTTASIPS